MSSSSINSKNALVEFLGRVPKLRRRYQRHLAERISSLEDFFRLSAEKLSEYSHGFSSEAQEALRLAQQNRQRIKSFIPYFSFLDPLYPSRLTPLHDPPCGLYYRGQLEILQSPKPWIGVVGTRKASDYALRYCSHMIAAWQPYQPVIVSGMALGIDGRAHEIALQCKLKTIAVLGSSLDAMYPFRHRALARRLIQEGLILSELAPGALMAAWRFPERNRILAALSDILIVVEAPEKSGALITADFALNLGKDIYVVPGPADTSQNRGGHRLIQQGARLLIDPEEIFQDLKISSPAQNIPPSKRVLASSEKQQPVLTTLSDIERQVLEILKVQPLDVDKIAAMSHLASAQVTGLLMQWSLQGWVLELPGRLFALSPISQDLLSKLGAKS